MAFLRIFKGIGVFNLMQREVIIIIIAGNNEKERKEKEKEELLMMCIHSSHLSSVSECVRDRGIKAESEFRRWCCFLDSCDHCV